MDSLNPSWSEGQYVDVRPTALANQVAIVSDSAKAVHADAKRVSGLAVGVAEDGVSVAAVRTDRQGHVQIIRAGVVVIVPVTIEWRSDRAADLLETGQGLDVDFTIVHRGRALQGDQDAEVAGYKRLVPIVGNRELVELDVDARSDQTARRIGRWPQPERGNLPLGHGDDQVGHLSAFNGEDGVGVVVQAVDDQMVIAGVELVAVFGLVDERVAILGKGDVILDAVDDAVDLDDAVLTGGDLSLEKDIDAGRARLGRSLVVDDGDVLVAFRGRLAGGQADRKGQKHCYDNNQSLHLLISSFEISVFAGCYLSNNTLIYIKNG